MKSDSREIRAGGKDYKILKRAYDKTTAIDKTFNVLTRDDSLERPIIMVHAEGEFVLWTEGRENVLSFINIGIVKIKRICPFSFLRMGKCKSEKCQWYHVRNYAGDCAVVWKLFV